VCEAGERAVRLDLFAVGDDREQFVDAGHVEDGGDTGRIAEKKPDLVVALLGVPVGYHEAVEDRRVDERCRAEVDDDELVLADKSREQLARLFLCRQIVFPDELDDCDAFARHPQVDTSAEAVIGHRRRTVLESGCASGVEISSRGKQKV